MFLSRKNNSGPVVNAKKFHLKEAAANKRKFSQIIDILCTLPFAKICAIRGKIKNANWQYNHLIVYGFFLFVVFFPLDIFSHPNDERLLKLSRSEAAGLYLKLGFTHIIPLGFDHILFVISLFLLNPKLKTVLWQATAFTVAHTITLGWATYQATYNTDSSAFSLPANIIEPVIALSIMFVAVENIITDKLKKSRIFIVFAFGLIHGLGFAGALADLGMPKNKFVLSLITFNVGVELGQIAVILIMWLCIGWFKNKPWYRKYIVFPLSAIIAATALFWTIQRTFFP